MKPIFLLLFALCITYYCMRQLRRAHFNFGAFALYSIAGASWLYLLFYPQIDAFTANGIGLILKHAFWFIFCTYCITILFLAHQGQKLTATGSEDALIVLGAGLRGEIVTGVLARRLQEALRFHHVHPNVPIVVSGGCGKGESIPESRAMKRYLIENGVDASLIFEESLSKSTFENFSFSKEIMKSNDFYGSGTVVFCTNVFHCYRARLTAKKVGFHTVHSLPAPTGALSALPCYLREVSALCYYILHDYHF